MGNSSSDATTEYAALSSEPINIVIDEFGSDEVGEFTIKASEEAVSTLKALDTRRREIWIHAFNLLQDT